MPEQKDKNLERIDFNSQQKIIEFGNNITNKIKKIINEVTIILTNEEVYSIDEETIQYLYILLDLTGSSNENTNTGLLDKIRSIFSSEQKQKKVEIDLDLQEQISILNNVKKQIEKQKQLALKSCVLKEAIISEIKPLLEKLESTIQLGILDKKEFDEQLEILRLNTKTVEDTFQLDYKERISDIANTHLNELNQTLIYYKTLVPNYTVLQNDDKNFIEKCNTLLDIIPVLENQIVLKKQLNNQLRNSNSISTLTEDSLQTIKENTKQVMQDMESRKKDNTELIYTTLQEIQDIKENQQITNENITKIKRNIKK